MKNIKEKTRILIEEIQDDDGDNLTVMQVHEFLSGIRNRHSMYVKVLKMDDDGQNLEVYDVYAQNDNVVTPLPGDGIVHIQANNDVRTELRLDLLIQDLAAVIQQTGWADLTFKIQLEHNDIRGIKIAYDDNSNMVYLVADQQHGHTRRVNWETICRWIEITVGMVHDLSTTYDMTNDSLLRVLGGTGQTNGNANDIRAHLIPMISFRLRGQAMRNLRTQQDNARTAVQTGNDNDDVDDVIDVNPEDDEHAEEVDTVEHPADDETAANFFGSETDDDDDQQTRGNANNTGNAGNADTEDQDDEENGEEDRDDEDDEDEDETEQPVQQGRAVGRLRLLGEFDDNMQYSNTPSENEFVMLFSPRTMQDTIAEIEALPDAVQQEILRRIDSKPMRFYRIDGGTMVNKRNNKGRLTDLFDQVYQSYRSFFIFDGRAKMVWKQTKRGSIQVLARTDLPTSVFTAMRTASGNVWVKELYHQTSTKDTMTKSIVIYDPDRYFTGVTTQTPGKNSQTDDNTTVRPIVKPVKLTPEQKAAARQKFVRKFITDSIYQRLLNEIVLRRVRVRYNIVDATRWQPEIPDKSMYFWMASSDGTAASQHGRILTMSAARKIAENYDRIVFTRINPNRMRTYMFNRDDIVMNNIRNILNPDNYTPPPEEQDALDISADERKKLDDTVEEVNRLLSKTGVEMQIVYPGRRPEYTWISGQIQKQCNNWPTDNTMKLAIMFPGLIPDKFVGDDAIRFLTEIDMIDTVRPAIDAASKAYDKIVPVVCLDNGIPH